jgi:hypothetical protein
MKRWEGSKDNWLGQSPLPPSRLFKSSRMLEKKLLAGPARIRAGCLSEVPRAAPREVLESTLHQVACHGVTGAFPRGIRGRGRQWARRTPPRLCAHATPWAHQHQAGTRASEPGEGRRFRGQATSGAVAPTIRRSRVRFAWSFGFCAVIMSRMANGRGGQRSRSGGARLVGLPAGDAQATRKRGAPVRTTSRFVRAFADALRDILKHESRRAA